mmetsp:Transcript_21271/g.63379  ORF Transcript_21271/g.63379 Transcript_21271/m.63379 type:complete len:242 (-) Transcript_21271:154-879(-)
MESHPGPKRPQPAQAEPAVERRHPRAHVRLVVPHVCKDAAVIGGDGRAGNHSATGEVRVPAQVLGERVEHQIGPEINGGADPRCDPGGVDHQQSAETVCHRRHRRNVRHLARRIGRRLHPHHQPGGTTASLDVTGSGLDGRGSSSQIRHVHLSPAKPPPRVHRVGKRADAVVDVVWHHEVPRGHPLQDGGRGGLARPEGGRGAAILERCQRLLEQLPRWVVRPGINETFGKAQVTVTLECG